MFLDGENIRCIKETCSSVLGISSGKIQEYIDYYISRGWIDDYVYKDESLMDLLIDEFDKKHKYILVEGKKYYNLEFEKVAVFHITSRINSNSFDGGIFTLRDVLNTENDIMNFLNEQGISIKLRQKSIEVISKQKIFSFTFGEPFYNRMIRDTSINGFLINHQIREISDVEHIVSCPEFVQSIANKTNRNDIVDKWKSRCEPIIIKFETDIRNIHIDTYRDIYDNALYFRKRYLIEKYLRFIAKASLNEINDRDKCMIFLNEYENVPPNSIIKILK